jgi:hypothetical protein
VDVLVVVAADRRPRGGAVAPDRVPWACSTRSNGTAATFRPSSFRPPSTTNSTRAIARLKNRLPRKTWIELSGRPASSTMSFTVTP